MKIKKLLFYLGVTVSFVKATTTNNNDGHDNYNINSTTNTDDSDGQDTSPLFSNEPTVPVSASSLLQYADIIDRDQLILHLHRNDVHDGGGEVYVGVGGGVGGGGDGHDHGGHPGGGGGYPTTNRLHEEWRTAALVQQVMDHTTAHSVEMVQYGQRINIDIIV